MTSNQEAIRRLFKVNRMFAGNLPEFPRVYPGQDGAIVRKGDDGARELCTMSWGFVLPQQGRAPKSVTNTRSDKAMESRFWRESVENRRCLVPVTSYCEWTDSRPKVEHWFTLAESDEEPPLFAFAGIWRDWKGKIKDEPVELSTYSFLTTTANGVVGPIHSKAMPVMLTPDDFDQWIDGTPDEAMELARPFPDGQMVDLTA